MTRKIELDYENLEFWKLRGQKLRYLRTHSQSKLIKQLSSDKEWVELMCEWTTLTRTDGIGSYERGQRYLKNEMLRNIAEYFGIDEFHLSDEVSYNEFVSTLKAENFKIKLNRIGYSKERKQKRKQLFFDYCNRWIKNGRDNSIIMEYVKQTDYVPVLDDIYDGLDKEQQIFLLLASLYRGHSWHRHVLRNINDEKIIYVMIKELNNSYFRIFFRTLYALQYYKYEIVEPILLQFGKKMRVDRFDITKKYLKERKVNEYLKDMANGSDNYIAERAKFVLGEIRYYWNDKTT